MHPEEEETQTVEITLPNPVPDTIIVNGATYERRQFSDYCYGVNRAIEEIETLAVKNGISFAEAKDFYFMPLKFSDDPNYTTSRHPSEMHGFWSFTQPLKRAK